MRGSVFSRIELAAHHIGVTTLFPAAVNTNIHDHAGMRPQALADTGLVSDPQQQRAMSERRHTKNAQRELEVC